MKWEPHTQGQYLASNLKKAISSQYRFWPAGTTTCAALNIWTTSSADPQGQSYVRPLESSTGVRMPRGWKDGVWTEPGTWSQEAGTQIQPSRNLFCMTLCTSLSLGINFSVGKMKVCMALDHVCKRKQCVSKCVHVFTCVEKRYTHLFTWSSLGSGTGWRRSFSLYLTSSHF